MITLNIVDLGFKQDEAELAKLFFIVFSNFIHFFMSLGFLYLGYKLGSNKNSKAVITNPSEKKDINTDEIRSILL